MAEAIGGIAGSLQGTATGLVNRGQSFIDRFLPPEKRASWAASLKKFASEKPALASFLLSHLAISGFPLALFFLMTLTVGIFALVAAVLVGLLGALVFIVFCVGIALIFLLPTLFFTTLVATFVWLWGVGAYFLLKWFNQEKIPGIHTSLGEGAKEYLNTGDDGSSENDKLPALNAPERRNGAPRSSSPGNDDNDKETGKADKDKGSEKKTGGGKGDPVDAVGKTTGIDAKNVSGEVRSKVNTDSLGKGVDTGSLTKGLPVG